MTMLRSYYSVWKREIVGPLAVAALAGLLVAGIAFDVRAGRDIKGQYETPATPTGFQIFDSGTYGVIYLFWSEPAYTTVFEIWRAENEAGPYSLLTTVNAPTDSYTDDTIVCGQTYYYKIRAGNCCFFSNFTAPLQGNALPCTIAADNCEQVTTFISSDYSEKGSIAGATNGMSFVSHNCFHDGPEQGSGPDVVYGVQTTEDCYLKITSTFGFVYVLRSECHNETICLDTPTWYLGSLNFTGFRTEAGTTYYVVVEGYDFSPGYDIEFEFFGCGDALPACPPGGTLFSQAPAAYGTTQSIGYKDSDGALDDFTTDGSPIRSVRWWGADVENGNVSECESLNTSFDIEFYGPGATPGALQAVYSVDASVVDPGADFTYYTAYQYSANLPVPHVATAGWIRIVSTTADNCTWRWLGSTSGNYNAVVDTNPLTTDTVDFAFCLGSAVSQHTADQTGDGVISLSELLRVIQFYNTGAYQCDAQGEDGYAPAAGATNCTPHASDYNPQNWVISLSELLRLIQFYNSQGYFACPDDATEDGYCPGTGN